MIPRVIECSYQVGEVSSLIEIQFGSAETGNPRSELTLLTCSP